MSKTAIPHERNWIAVAILAELAGKPVGYVMTFAECRKIGGTAFQNRHALAAARWAVRDHGQVWVSVRGVGYRRAADAQVTEHVAAHRLSIHRKSGRLLAKLATVDPEKLTPEERVAHAVESTRHFLVMRSAGSDAGRRLRAAVEGNGQKKLPPTMAFRVME